MPGSLTTETISKLPEVSNRGQKSEQMGPTIHCTSISQETGRHCVPLVVFLDEYKPGGVNILIINLERNRACERFSKI